MVPTASRPVGREVRSSQLTKCMTVCGTGQVCELQSELRVSQGTVMKTRRPGYWIYEELWSWPGSQESPPPALLSLSSELDDHGSCWGHPGNSTPMVPRPSSSSSLPEGGWEVGGWAPLTPLPETCCMTAAGKQCQVWPLRESRLARTLRVKRQMGVRMIGPNS